MKYSIINTGKYLIIVDKNLVNMPKNINVYSVRYRDVIRFGEVENSYSNECYEILSHLPLNHSPILEGVDLLPFLSFHIHGIASNGNVLKYSEEDIRKIVGAVAYDVRENGYGACSVANHYASVWVKGNQKLLQSFSSPKIPIAFEPNFLNETDAFMEVNTQDRIQRLNNEQGIPVWQGHYINE